jgi:hypothetical protein
MDSANCQKSIKDLAFLHVPGICHKPTIAKEFLFVNNSLPASPGERRGKQGGSHDVRAHVSRRSRLEKREKKNEEKSRYVALAPRLRPGGELEGFNNSSPDLEPDAGHRSSPSEEEPLDLDEAFDKEQVTTLSQNSLVISNDIWKGRVKGVAKVEQLGGGKFDPFSTFPTSIANASTLAHELVDIGK